MDSEEKAPSFFDERDPDPEAPYRMGKPHRDFHQIKGFLYIAGVLLLVLLVILSYIFIKPLLYIPEKPSAESTTKGDGTEIAVTGWKTYRKNGMWEFGHPQNWIVLFEENGPRTTVGITDKVSRTGEKIGNVFLQVGGDNADNSFDFMLEKDVGTKDVGISMTRVILDKTTVDGFPSVTYSLEEANTSKEYSYSIVTLIKGPFNVNISGLSLNPSTKPNSEFVALYLPIHKEIVSSFRFAK
jgi:hypothetical protein